MKFFSPHTAQGEHPSRAMPTSCQPRLPHRSCSSADSEASTASTSARGSRVRLPVLLRLLVKPPKDLTVAARPRTSRRCSSLRTSRLPHRDWIPWYSRLTEDRQLSFWRTKDCRPTL